VLKITNVLFLFFLLLFSCSNKDAQIKINNLQSNVDLAMNKNADHETEIEKLKEENQKINGEIERVKFLLQEKINTLSEEIKNLKQSLETIKEVKEKKEKENKKKKKEIEKVKNKIKSLSIDERYKAARKYHQNKEYEKAENAYLIMKGTKSSWYNERVHYFLGLLYYETKRYEKAIYILQELIQKFPKSKNIPGAIYYQAESLIALGKTKDAKPFLQELILYYPKSKEANKAKKRLNQI
jgi:TolA-binding protein